MALREDTLIQAAPQRAGPEEASVSRREKASEREFGKRRGGVTALLHQLKRDGGKSMSG